MKWPVRACLATVITGIAACANADAGDVPQIFDVTGGSANPFASDTSVTAKASNGSATNAATFQLYFVQTTA